MADASSSRPPGSGRADPADEAALVAHATALADAVDAVLDDWVHRCVERFLPAAATDPELAAATDDAARRCRGDVGTRVRALLATDVDDQVGTPLTLLRDAVRYPTAVLRAAGVPAVRRDEFSRSSFPDDDYDLTPASFADVDPSLHEPGLVWGAAKAHVHLARRRAEGRT
ncbi:MAG: hypothetical protein ACOYOP_08765 [Microthrixaceae bacterium]